MGGVTTLSPKIALIAAEMPSGCLRVISIPEFYVCAGSPAQPETSSRDFREDETVENLDRFFDAYDRFLPRYFSEVAVALLLFGSVAFFSL